MPKTITFTSQLLYQDQNNLALKCWKCVSCISTSKIEIVLYVEVVFISFSIYESPRQLIKPIKLIDNLFRLIDQFKVFWETFLFFLHFISDDKLTLKYVSPTAVSASPQPLLGDLVPSEYITWALVAGQFFRGSRENICNFTWKYL